MPKPPSQFKGTDLLFAEMKKILDRQPPSAAFDRLVERLGGTPESARPSPAKPRRRAPKR